MAISKLIFNGVTQMDVTGDTVTTNTLVSPATATKNDGTQITGALETKTSSDLTASGATVTVPAGVYSSDAIKSVSTMTLPTSASSSSSGTSKATISRSTSAQYINSPTGYNDTASYYTVSAVPNGVATSASSISGTGATVSSSSTTITLSKSVSNTPRITTTGYISSGTAGSSSVSLSATDSNFTEANIKKDVSIFGKTGTYEGSSGTVALTPYTIRPDAELIKTYSDDFLVVTDKGVTKPAYTTTSTTLITGGTALSSTVTLSNADYRYYIVMRHLTIPQYSSTTKAAGRQEYTAMSSLYEIVGFDANTFSALVSSTKYGSRNVAVMNAGNAYVRCVYWSSGSAIKVYTANSYGCVQTINTAPAISSATAASPTVTFYTPNVVIRGSSSYLSSTYWNYITDIRCQYIYQVYRVPKNTDSTYGISGWNQYNNMLQLLTCAQSTTHNLS